MRAVVPTGRRLDAIAFDADRIALREDSPHDFRLLRSANDVRKDGPAAPAVTRVRVCLFDRGPTVLAAHRGGGLWHDRSPKLTHSWSCAGRLIHAARERSSRLL